VTLRGWRIVRRSRSAEAFSGEGARRYGGRWNSPGLRIVYASDSLSLAALETLVHINPYTPMAFVYFALEWPADITEEIASPPTGWDISPSGPASQRVGDAWCEAGRSAVLAVPSVLVPAQRNFLLNPGHPDFSQIKIHPPQPFTFDPRLLPS
jgi:RES domain-containing protein